MKEDIKIETVKSPIFRGHRIQPEYTLNWIDKVRCPKCKTKLTLTSREPSVKCACGEVVSK